MPSSSGASRAEAKIVVGPSAPPMMAIAPASLMSKPTTRAIQRAANTPIWAAAPSSSVFGLAMIGPKSVSAPKPRKISGGRMFHLNSANSKITPRMPDSCCSAPGL